MNTNATSRRPAGFDLDFVTYDFAVGFHDDPEPTLEAFELLLKDRVNCTGRIAWLRGIHDAAVSLQLSGCNHAVDSGSFQREISLVNELGLLEAYESGRLSASRLSQLANDPDALQSMHGIFLGSTGLSVSLAFPHVVRLSRVFHLPAVAAADSLQEPVDDQMEIAVRGHRTIVNVHRADDSDWTVQLQSRQPEVARECRVSVVLLKANSEEPDTEQLVFKDSDEEVSGWPVVFREMPDGWFLGSVTFSAEDVIRDVGSQTFQIGLQAAEPATESQEKSVLTESETPTSLLSDVDTRVVAQSPSKIIEQVLSRKVLISRLLKRFGVASDQSSEFCEFAQAKSKDWVGGDLRKTLLLWCHHYAQEQGLEVPTPELSNKDWQSLIVDSSIQAIVGRHFTNEPEWKQEIRGILTQSDISIVDELLMVTIPPRLTDHRGFDAFRSNLYIELQNEISLVQQLLGLSVGVETPECQTDRNHQETD